MNALSIAQKKTILLLGLPSFGLALSATAVVTFVPLIAKQFTSSTTVVGAIIAIEGLIALFLPVLAGTWSDHLRTRLGGRLPFLITGLPISAAMLVLIGFVGSLLGLIVCLSVFFAAYYFSYEPYRALYPDLTEDRMAGRAQSIQAMWRGIGTAVALIGGGFLFGARQWLPFVMAAFLTLASTVVFLAFLLKKRGVPKQRRRQPETAKESYLNAVRLLKGNSDLRWFVVANTLWELTLAALKSFILLFLTVGLGKSKTLAAIVISVTATIMFLAAPFAGLLGDRYGKIRVARIAAVVFGLGLLLPVFTTQMWILLPILPIVAVGGATVLTLPYAILMPMMPDDQHGKLTGLYSTSRGIGIMLGPLLAGVFIALLKHVLPARGYSAMWLVCSAAMLLSVAPLGNLNDD